VTVVPVSSFDVGRMVAAHRKPAVAAAPMNALEEAHAALGGGPVPVVVVGAGPGALGGVGRGRAATGRTYTPQAGRLDVRGMTRAHQAQRAARRPPPVPRPPGQAPLGDGFNPAAMVRFHQVKRPVYVEVFDWNVNAAGRVALGRSRLERVATASFRIAEVMPRPVSGYWHAAGLLPGGGDPAMLAQLQAEGQ
jgi:hypothetical protein